jgi:hypothetical protein
MAQPKRSESNMHHKLKLLKPTKASAKMKKPKAETQSANFA